MKANMLRARKIFRKCVMCIALFFVLIGNVLAQQTIKRFHADQQEKIIYLLYLPGHYDKSENDRYPLILFLHGSGESGTDINLVKTQGLPAYLDTCRSFPAIVVSPQCPDSRQGWNRYLLYDLLQSLFSKYKIDTNRVYITGLSMGAKGCWDMLTYYPELFAAAVPVCGWGDDRLIRRAKKVAIRIYHGEDDDVVPATYSIKMYEALKSNNGNVELVIYPKTKHDAWTRTYQDKDLYSWLWKQKRDKTKYMIK
jgi:predicted peptidase